MVHTLCRVWFLLAPALVSIFSMQCLAADILMYKLSKQGRVHDAPLGVYHGVHKSYELKFGPPLGMNGLGGFVVYNSSDGIGCNSDCILPPPINGPHQHWILLLERMDCSFVDKVRNAQLKHYDMVIIFNHEFDYTSEPMRAINASDIFIPSVFVSHETGLIIRDKYQYFHNGYLVIR